MKRIAIIWGSVPRFLRGWFLGNIVYVVLAVVGMRHIPVAVVADVPAIMIIHSLLSSFYMRSFMSVVRLQYDWLHYFEFLLPHFFWCSLCAVMVAWKNEIKGVVLAVLLMIVISVLFFLWVVLNFRMTML